MTPEVSHALMSSLKDAAAVHTSGGPAHGQVLSAQNKSVMFVNPDVSHIEMWPYVDSALVGFENQARTAFPIVLSSITQTPCLTPHDVDAHELLGADESPSAVPSNASVRVTVFFKHQPRSWLEAKTGA